MIKISNYLPLSIVLFVIFPSVLSMQDGHWTILTGLGIFSFVLINLILILSKRLYFNIPYPLTILFFGLFISSLISFLIVGKLRPVINYGALIFLFLVVRTLSSQIRDLDRLIINIVFGACLAVPLVMLIGIDKPFLGENTSFTFYRFRGFFSNANSMGMFVAFIMHMIIGVLYAFKNSLSRLSKIYFYLIFFLSTIFLLASNSRSAILSVIVVLGVVLVIELFKRIKFSNGKIYFSNLRGILRLFSLIILFCVIIYWTGALDNTIEKFFIKRATVVTDISDGRISGWLFAIKNWNWFGYFDFVEFAELNGMLRVGHSTWISHLNNFGLSATFFFIFWILFMLYWAWRQIRTEKDSSSVIVFFLTLLGFFINASFQTATSTPGLATSIIMFAILFNKKNFYEGKNVSR